MYLDLFLVRSGLLALCFDALLEVVEADSDDGNKAISEPISCDMK